MRICGAASSVDDSRELHTAFWPTTKITFAICQKSQQSFFILLLVAAVLTAAEFACFFPIRYVENVVTAWLVIILRGKNVLNIIHLTYLQRKIVFHYIDVVKRAHFFGLVKRGKNNQILLGACNTVFCVLTLHSRTVNLSYSCFLSIWNCSFSSAMVFIAPLFRELNYGQPFCREAKNHSSGGFDWWKHSSIQLEICEKVEIKMWSQCYHPFSFAHNSGLIKKTNVFERKIKKTKTKANIWWNY